MARHARRTLEKHYAIPNSRHLDQANSRRISKVQFRPADISLIRRRSSLTLEGLLPTNLVAGDSPRLRRWTSAGGIARFSGNPLTGPPISVLCPGSSSLPERS
jgi:hypothetical protein